MKIFKILLALVILSFLSATCSENSPTQTNKVTYGNVVLSFEKTTIPEDVIIIKATLTRSTFEPISDTLNLINSNNAEIVMNEIPAGTWHLRVEALDSSNTLLYEGDSDVNIISDQLVQVNLTLTPVSNGTGSIYIIVTWGNNNSDWIDYESNPILQSQGTNFDPFGVTHSFILKDNSLYKMWFSGIADNGKFAIFYATSEDGLNWNYYNNIPVLLPGSYGSWDDLTVVAPVVIKEDGNYKMYYTGWRDSHSQWSIGIANSTDGIVWHKLPNPIIIGGQMPWKLKVYASDIEKVNNLYYLYFTDKNDLYDSEIGLAQSTDGINWIEVNPHLLTTTQSWEGSSILHPTVIREDSVYTMVYCNNTLNETTAFGLAYSNDGIHWVKDTNNPIFNENMTIKNYLHISYPFIFKNNNDYMIYYTGWIGNIRTINITRNSVN